MNSEMVRDMNPFSNDDSNVFVITTPNQVDRGALMARYSRTSKSMRDVWKDEFADNSKRGKEFYDRVLSEFGDDSVAELGTAQIAIEGISNLAVQDIEARRVGLSFLEKSSRYVRWDQKIDGKYQYYSDPKIMESRYADRYANACDMSFRTYTHMYDPIYRYIKEQNPQVTDDTKAYERSVKAATLDIVRNLLPLSTLTNLGITGNGRAFEYMIYCLKASALTESNGFAKKIHAELNTVMEPFLKRIDGKHGKGSVNYLRSLNMIRREIPVTLGEPDKYGEKKSDEMTMLYYIISKFLNNRPDRETIREHCYPKPTKEECIAIFNELIQARKNRRDSPPREFELLNLEFKVTSSIGTFRDLRRHRLVTFLSKPFIAEGILVPKLFKDLSMLAEYKECMINSHETYCKIAGIDPIMAQYVLNFGGSHTYYMKMNLRELTHFVELRSLPQGHHEYRTIAQQMYKDTVEKYPGLSKIIKFVNTENIPIGRLSSEIRVAKALQNGTQNAVKTP